MSSLLIDFRPIAPHEIMNGEVTNEQPIFGAFAAQAPIKPNIKNEPTTNFFLRWPHIESITPPIYA